MMGSFLSNPLKQHNMVDRAGRYLGTDFSNTALLESDDTCII